MRTTLIVDADNVLFHFQRVARQLATEEGIGLQDCDVNPCVPGTWDAFAAAVDRRPGWVRSMPVMPLVVDVLYEIRGMGADVICATRVLKGCMRWHSERAAALESLGFTHDDMYFCADKSRILGHVFVDDDPAHIRRWQLAHLSGIAVLWDYPSTRLEPLHHNSIRTSDWNHVITAVRSFLAYHEGAR
jgi:5'(3')-deoxyribonucleotidase